MKPSSSLGILWLSLQAPRERHRARTPIRWLCLRAFSYLSLVQRQTLSSAQLDQLSAAIELGVMLNRYFDGKQALDRRRYLKLRRKLRGAATTLYLSKLRKLESSRPHYGPWGAIYEYRRKVLEISLGHLFQLAGMKAVPSLLPLCSLIQLTDDVLDQKIDKELGLPSFLFQGGPSASRLAHQFWIELCSKGSPTELPLRIGAWLTYLFTQCVIAVCRLRPDG